MKRLALLALTLVPLIAAGEGAASQDGAAAAPASSAPSPQPAPPLGERGQEASAPTPTSTSTPKPPKPAWKGTLGAGLILLRGNSDATTFTGSFTASRESIGWIASAKATGAYGRSRPPEGGPRSTTADAGGLQLRLDKKFGGTWSAYELGGLEFDHVAAVEYRTVAEAGAAAQWLDRKEGDWQRLGLRSDLGFRYGYEARRAYYGPTPGPLPGVLILAPRVGLAFRWGFSKEVFFTEEAEAVPTLGADHRVLVKSAAKLSSRLTTHVALGVSQTMAFDSRPADAKKKTDMSVTALLEVGY